MSYIEIEKELKHLIVTSLARQVFIIVWVLRLGGKGIVIARRGSGPRASTTVAR